MDNIITALFRYAKDWTVDSEPFKWNDTIIQGEDAMAIIMELNENEYLINTRSERVQELEDYNRLLREENKRLRDGIDD